MKMTGEKLEDRSIQIIQSEGKRRKRVEIKYKDSQVLVVQYQKGN